MRLGILIVGLNGATATTFVTCAKLIGAGLVPPAGLVTASPLFDRLPSIDWSSASFGGWDVSPKNQLERAKQLGIVPPELVDYVRAELADIKPYPACASHHDIAEVRSAAFLKRASSANETIVELMEDIASFTSARATEVNIVIYLGSPLALRNASDWPETQAELELSLARPNADVPSAILYYLAAVRSRCAFIDFTPNPTLELRYLQDLAVQMQVPIAGRDGSTGQTLLKSVIAETFSVRGLRLHGWFSTNILGNHDGEVLARSEHAVTKMKDKMGVLAPILGYNDFEHKVDISFYGPRGDNKESWDVADFSGLLGLPMSLRLNWLGRDSPLAAALLMDLTRLLTESIRRKTPGVQSHLGVFFKNPIGSDAHGFFRQYLELLEWCGIDWRSMP